MEPTPYKEINFLLTDLLTNVKEILGKQFNGMYLYGSLALGDFNFKNSDIDVIIITHSQITGKIYTALYKMHERLKSVNDWAKRLEVAYIAKEVFKNEKTGQAKLYPQIEKGRTLSKEPLEIGWAFQRYVLREYGIAIDGIAPKLWIEPIDPQEMHHAAIKIVKMWKDQATHDPTWIEWVKVRKEQSFVILTLCRFFYMIKFGKIASKLVAAQWALSNMNDRWNTMIKSTLVGQQDSTIISDKEVKLTIAMIDDAYEVLNKGSI